MMFALPIVALPWLIGMYQILIYNLTENNMELPAIIFCIGLGFALLGIAIGYGLCKLLNGGE